MAEEARFANLIVTYNSANEIIDLLGDLCRQTLYRSSQVIVVDNASQDRTAALVAASFPEVHLICNRENLGYARAVNQGFDLCTTDYVFLLNPDMRIPDSAFCSTMLACMEGDPRVAAAGPLQLQQAGSRRRLNLTWSYWSRRGLAIFFSRNLGSSSCYDAPIPTRFLNAGCLLIRRSAFMAVGTLDERYFLYGEEPDLFLKFMRHGYACRLHPGVEVIHYRERSLKTLPTASRLLVRARGVLNICDAVMRGCAKMALDRLRPGQGAWIGPG